MATYYVRTDGSDANAGTGPATNQAWQTITKALGAAGIGSGDTLYIAPGVYRGNFVINASAFSAATYIIGDVTASQFSGISAGSVRLSSRLSDTAAYSGNSLTGTSKPFLNISNIYFDGPVSLDQCNNLLIEKCLFYGINEAGGVCLIGTATGATTRNIFRRNIVISPGNSSSNIGFATVDRVANQGASISDCYFITNTFGCYISPTVSNTDIRIYNCTFSGYALGAHIRAVGNFPGSAIVQNCLFVNGSSASGVMTATTLGNYTENFNRILMPGTARTNVASGANSVTTLGWDGIEYGQSLLMGYDYLQMYTALASSPNIDFGTSTNAPTSDIYGVTWTGTTPTAGATAYRSLNGIGFYNPTERNASTITIAPGSTSQTLHLYLGATGLVYNTSGLSARFTRSGSNSVAISLVSQTSNGAWVSGGFAEIDAINQPGLYRLDVPNAAFVSGVNRVTITVRGASGTNGAVVDCQLISSQLDLTQAVPTSNTANTIGDCLNAARAQGFGKWAVTGTTLRLYAPDGTTVVRTFTLDSETSPSQRV